jgi:hypothetical protein
VYGLDRILAFKALIAAAIVIVRKVEDVQRKVEVVSLTFAEVR